MYIELTTPQNRSGCSETSCGPGGMPWISSAPNISAIVALAGMPSVSSGMNDEVAAALFAVSGAATPSIAPLPEPLGLLGPALLDRVGDQRRQRRAAAGQHAEHEADHRAATDGAPRTGAGLRGTARRW